MSLVTDFIYNIRFVNLFKLFVVLCLIIRQNSSIFVRYPVAIEQFQQALKCMRGNKVVDYKQLGLKYQLYECEVGAAIFRENNML